MCCLAALLAPRLSPRGAHAYKHQILWIYVEGFDNYEIAALAVCPGEVKVTKFYRVEQGKLPCPYTGQLPSAAARPEAPAARSRDSRLPCLYAGQLPSTLGCRASRAPAARSRDKKREIINK